jgi:hypothetical protein
MNKKGLDYFIVALILGLLIFGVVGTSFANTAKKSGGFFKNFGQPKIEYTNDFMFTAESIDMRPTDAGLCVKNTDKSNLYTCNRRDVEFFVTINNQDTKKPLRYFYSGIVVCEAELKKGDYINKEDSCFQDLLVTAKSDECVIEGGMKAPCDIIYYSLTSLESGNTYNVYPLAEIKGCETGNEPECTKEYNSYSENIKSFNPLSYITIIVN